MSIFHPVSGAARILYILGALAASAIFIALLTLVPQLYRKYIIRLVTFLAGLYFALEFFLPVHAMKTPQDPTATGNFLTPGVVPATNFFTIVGAWTVGLGVINLCQLHGKRVLKGSKDSFFSAVFFVSMFVMMVVGVLKGIHPNAINLNEYSILFDGALANLDATMFSIIAFYIVSAAYRAFRVRSVEATLLLVTAVVVMLGQIAYGQWLTHWLPTKGPHDFLGNFHVEVIRSWILTIANAAATRAISFGLGIGGLAVALRIWLGLERGSYFEGQS